MAWVAPAEGAGAPARARSARLARRRLGVILLFVAPALVLYGVYTLYPVALSLWYSLLDWNGIAPGKFVGLDNWRQVIHDDNVLSSLRNTLIILVSSLAVEIPIGLSLALLIQRLGRLGSALSSIYVLPLLISSVAVGITWSFLYNPDFGPLFYLYNAFGKQAPGLLGSPSLAIWSVSVVVLWQYIPLYMLIFNAGLMAIPRELYESAAIDGAGSWARFWSITLPLLRRTFITAVVLILTGSLVYFDLVYVMTGGGPGNASYTLAMYVYRSAFQDQNVGYGSTIAVLLFALSFLVSSLIVRFSRLLQGD